MKNTLNNALGIWLMLAGFATFSVVDLIAKLLTADFHPVQIAWTRQLGASLVMVYLALFTARTIFVTTAFRLQVIRGLCAVTSATLFIVGISYVPLADAVAVTFVAPFLVTLMGAFFLREPVGIRRWSAVIVGFIGTLIIIRPGLGVFHPAIFLILLAACAFALRQVISRPIGQKDPAMTTLAYTVVTSVVVLTVPLPLFWQTPDSLQHVVMMIVMALLGGVGEFFIIKALSMAHAVVVSPMHYSLIIFGTLWGYLFFDQLPDQWTWMGTAIVVASGLYVFYREYQLNRKGR